jgi:hypothetical protein
MTLEESTSVLDLERLDDTNSTDCEPELDRDPELEPKPELDIRPSSTRRLTSPGRTSGLRLACLVCLFSATVLER